jgi:RNA polymerase sporulation-specific sigma factor
MARSATSPALPVPARRPGAPVRRYGGKSQGEVELDDHYLIALAKAGRKDAYDRIVKRYYGFVRLKASS